MPGRAWTEPVTGMEFVWVPAGCARLGGRADRKDCTDGFGRGEYEVTQAEWIRLMGDNPSEFRGDRLPVEQVRKQDAQAFADKLNKFGSVRFRLPFENEWADPPTPKKYTVLRGGSWAHDFDDVNVFSGLYYEPYDVYATMGFRLVIEPDQNQ